jgi:ElaB/YqjD/DUF883 family membrane-anchored ribosome-binding protein
MAFPKFSDDMTSDLEAQVSRLQKEVRSLRKALGKHGTAAYDTSKVAAAEFYGEMADRMADAWPVVQKQSRAVRRAASDHPVTTAVVGLALVGLIVGLLSRR